jgi:hypothetical protein
MTNHITRSTSKKIVMFTVSSPVCRGLPGFPQNASNSQIPEPLNYLSNKDASEAVDESAHEIVDLPSSCTQDRDSNKIHSGRNVTPRTVNSTAVDYQD